jgi:uncharacterized Tic20 family protein
MSDANATPAPQPAGPLTPAEDQKWAMWSHFGGIVGFLPSLIIWLVFKDRGAKVNTEAKEALNWQITITIISIGVGIIMGIIAGVITGIAISSLNSGMLAIVPLITFIGWVPWLANIIFSVMGGIKVSGGGSYRYPFNFRFIK